MIRLTCIALRPGGPSRREGGLVGWPKETVAAGSYHAIRRGLATHPLARRCCEIIATTNDGSGACYAVGVTYGEIDSLCGCGRTINRRMRRHIELALS